MTTQMMGQMPQKENPFSQTSAIGGNTTVQDNNTHGSELCNVIQQDLAIKRYLWSLLNFPTPGEGNTHKHMYYVACLGVKAGLGASELKMDIENNMKRHPKSPTEVDDAIRSAQAKILKVQPNSPIHHTRRKGNQSVKQDPALIQAQAAGGPRTFEYLIRCSPHPIPTDYRRQGLDLVTKMFKKEEIVACGDRYCTEDSMFPAYLLEIMLYNPPPREFISTNPFTGQRHLCKNGSGYTKRGDNCVAAPRHLLLEFDKMPLGDQVAILYRRIQEDPRFVSVVYSGGRSLHALLRVDLPDAEAWNRYLESDDYAFWLRLGADPMCKNPSRFTRLPGVLRRDTMRIQELLWLTNNNIRGEA